MRILASSALSEGDERIRLYNDAGAYWINGEGIVLSACQMRAFMKKCLDEIDKDLEADNEL